MSDKLSTNLISQASYNSSAISKAASARGINALFGSSSESPGVPGQQESSKYWPPDGQTDEYGIVPDSSFQNLVRYAQFCAVASQPCAQPLGATLVSQFGEYGETCGYIARDDKNQELVLVLSAADNSSSTLSKDPSSSSQGLVRASLLDDLDSAIPLERALRTQVASYPSYGVTLTGHGTGGALAALAATRLASPGLSMQVVTYGAATVGDADWVKYHDTLFNEDGAKRSLRVIKEPDAVDSQLAYAGVPLMQMADISGAMELIDCSSSNPRCQASSTPTFDTAVQENTPISAPPMAQSPIVPSASNPNQVASSLNDVDSSGSQFGVPCSSCIGTACVGCINDLDDSKIMQETAMSSNGVTSTIPSRLHIGIAKPVKRDISSTVFLGVDMSAGNQYCMTSGYTSSADSLTMISTILYVVLVMIVI